MTTFFSTANKTFHATTSCRRAVVVLTILSYMFFLSTAAQEQERQHVAGDDIDTPPLRSRKLFGGDDDWFLEEPTFRDDDWFWEEPTCCGDCPVSCCLDNDFFCTNCQRGFFLGSLNFKCHQTRQRIKDAYDPLTGFCSVFDGCPVPFACPSDC